MQQETIHFGDHARIRIKQGIDKVVDAVRITLGPKGRNVVIDMPFGPPTITNDGVTIAKAITFPNDRMLNMGAEIVKEVASKTNDGAGDGTTTSSVIFQALVQEGMEVLKEGVNVMAVRRGMEKAGKIAVEYIVSQSIPAKEIAQLRDIAVVSAENKEIGDTIADILKTNGKDSVISVIESSSPGIKKEWVDGLEFSNGFINPFMMNNPERLEAKHRDVRILFTTQKISTFQQLVPIIEKVSRAGSKELVVIADDFDPQVIGTMVMNRMKNLFNVLAIKAPSFGAERRELLMDMAALTGGTVVTQESGIALENTMLDHLGKATTLTAKKDSTLIAGGKGKKEDIEQRVKTLRAEMEKEKEGIVKDRLEVRIAKMANGVCLLHVGAATETEMKYLKLKIEDAIAATKAAMAEGIVAGGGTIFLQAAEHLSKQRFSGDEKTGLNIVIKALRRPLMQILLNSGVDESKIASMVDVISDSKHSGYDAKNDKLVDDMLKEGIVDPVKVSRQAVMNSVSAAAMLLTTEAAVTQLIQEEQHNFPHI